MACRYCHVFRRGEVEELVVQAGNGAVVDSYYDTSNWCVVAERTA